MDIQTGLICLGCVCVSVIVIYLTTLISIREKSYDEAIAEVRKSNQNLIKTTKVDKQVKKDKKRGKKNKEKIDQQQQQIREQNSNQDSKLSELPTEKAIKAATATASAVVAEIKFEASSLSKGEHVNFKEPEVIEVDVDENVSRSRRSSLSSNGKPTKPILKNESKTDVTAFNKQHYSPKRLQRSNSFEIIKPKDELELAKIGKKAKHKESSSERMNGDIDCETKSQSPKKDLPGVQENVEPVAIVENKVGELTVEMESANSLDKVDSGQDGNLKKINNPSTHKVKKAKSSQNKGATNESNSKRIIKIIDESSLTNEEVQLVINTLLNKQSEDNGQSMNGYSSMNSSPFNDTSMSSEWMKKNDPIYLLKKQLRDKDQLLDNEKSNYHAAMTKMEELRHELKIEKNKQLTEKNSNERQLQELHQRYQQQQLILQEQHRNELKNMQAKFQHLQTKLTDERNVAIQRLQEESNRHQTVLQQLEASRTSVDKLNQYKHENDKLRNDINQYENHQINLKQLNEELHRKVAQLEERIKSLMTAKQTDEYNYQQKLNDLKSQIQINESTKINLIEELSQLKSKVTTNDQELNLLKKSNDEKVNEITKKNLDSEHIINKLTEECKCLNEQLINKEKQIEELNKVKEDICNANAKESEINELNSELMNVKELNSNLKNEYDTLNKELTDNNKVNTEQKLKINHLESEKNELINKINDLTNKQTTELSEIEIKLKDEINERNALISECGKLLHVQLHTSEDVLAKLKTVIEENERREKDYLGKQEEVNSLLEKINRQSDQQLTQKSEELAILNEKLNSLAEENKELINQINDLKDKLSSNEIGNEKMQAQVEQYKQVLSKTDQLLKDLEEDAKRVESEWKAKLIEKENQIDELLKRLKTET